MNQKTEHKIKQVVSGSIAEELGVEPGDVLISVSDREVEDIFDYQYLQAQEDVTLVIRKANGEEWELEAEKDEDEDLGILFENSLMDDYHSCSNHCIFCFIDQNPKGMRPMLYFKDDDSRLSFLQGNYVTLTNMSQGDIDRILRYRLEPIHISFHTTNPELRCMMLGNRFAGDIMEKAGRLCDPENGVVCNGQIVLCKGINDGEELHRTLTDLYSLRPNLQSVSVVPVGLSRHREGLYPLEPFEKADAEAVIDEIERWQQKAFADNGNHFVHASDEWYYLAERTMPEEERYDGYVQLENGVGKARLLMTETEDAFRLLQEKVSPEFLKSYQLHASLVIGRLVEPTVRRILDRLQELAPGVQIDLYPVRNDFYGERITVTGLLTGGDIIAQLTGHDLGEKLFLPSVMLRPGDDILLDDVRWPEIQEALKTPVEILSGDGYNLVSEVFGVTVLQETEDE